MTLDEMIDRLTEIRLNHHNDGSIPVLITNKYTGIVSVVDVEQDREPGTDDVAVYITVEDS